MPRASNYQKHKKELLEKQRARRKKQKEEKDRARGISYEELLRQRKEEREREDPFFNLNEGSNPW